jgi:hypothetical protein
VSSVLVLCAPLFQCLRLSEVLSSIDMFQVHVQCSGPVFRLNPRHHGLLQAPGFQ